MRSVHLQQALQGEVEGVLQFVGHGQARHALDDAWVQ